MGETLISDIDAPHLLRDLAREERIMGRKRIAARLVTLADEVAAILSAAERRPSPGGGEG